MNIRIIGKARDPWAAATLASVPREAKQKTVLLVGTKAQILGTIFFWLARYRVFWLGESGEFNPVAKRFVRMMSRASSAIIAPNQAIEAQYLKAGVNDKKLSLIYPSCEPQTPNAPKDDQTFTIACDGETSIEHGLGMIMRAVRNSCDILGNVRLVIGGAIADRGRIEWLAQELGLRAAIKLVPAQGYDWISGSDMFLFMRNNSAPVPLALAHALARGLPIVTNDAPGHREFVIHHKNGILLKDANSDMLSLLLINLARKPEWLAQLGRESARFAEERFSPEAVQKKMRALIP